MTVRWIPPGELFDSSAMIARMRDEGALLAAFTADPYLRRTRWRRHRLLPWRFVRVFAETKAQHAARVAKLPPRPSVYVYPVRSQ